MSADSHRRRGGDPKLEITTGPTVEWRVTQIDHGDPQTVAGQKRQDGIDIYFLVENAEAVKGLLRSFPTVTAVRNSSLVRPAVNPSGMERAGGKRIRPIYPIAAFEPMRQVTIRHTSKAPEFEAVATNVKLHVEYEMTPVRGYGAEMVELHFGVRGDYTVAPSAPGGQNEALLEMSPEFYATVLDEVLRSI